MKEKQIAAALLCVRRPIVIPHIYLKIYSLGFDVFGDLLNFLVHLSSVAQLYLLPLSISHGSFTHEDNASPICLLPEICSVVVAAIVRCRSPATAIGSKRSNQVFCAARFCLSLSTFSLHFFQQKNRMVLSSHQPNSIVLTASNGVFRKCINKMNRMGCARAI